MRQLWLPLALLLIAAGALDCTVAEPPPSASEPAVTALVTVAAPVVQPHFNQCLAGATCVADTQCDGEPTTVACAVGKHCCNPRSCAGLCVSFATFCQASNQVIDSEAVCPGGGVCCLTFVD